MRIISKFKDYYDGGAIYGIDKTHTFIRKTEEIILSEIPLSINEPHEIIGFCGEIYVILNIKREALPEDFIYCSMQKNRKTLTLKKSSQRAEKRTGLIKIQNIFHK